MMNIFNFKFMNEFQWSIYVRRKSGALYSIFITAFMANLKRRLQVLKLI